MDILNYFRLIPAFQRWTRASEGEEDWHAFRSYTSRVEHMLNVISLIRPEFIELEGLIVNRDRLPEAEPTSYISEMKRNGLSDSNIEYLINHVHIKDSFINDADVDDIPDEVFEYLAQIVAELWRCRLNHLYPNRLFIVGVADQGTSGEIYAYSKRETHPVSAT